MNNWNWRNDPKVAHAIGGALTLAAVLFVWWWTQ